MQLKETQFSPNLHKSNINQGAAEHSVFSNPHGSFSKMEHVLAIKQILKIINELT